MTVVATKTIAETGPLSRRAPDRPCLMHMTWRDLLFAHWPIEPARLRPLIPAGLELDTFGAAAWVGVVPFHMTGIRLRGCPPVPTTAAFPEINLRTYVRHGDTRGVWFLSLDAPSLLAVCTARWLFHLRYTLATIRCERRGGFIEYDSRRWRGDARFVGRYRGIGETFHARPETLEHFLCERYSLFAADRRGRLWRGEVDHEPWTLRRAEAEVRTNTMARAAGIELPDTRAHLLYAEVVQTRVWGVRRVGRG